jgi:hypothetical protein
MNPFPKNGLDFDVDGAKEGIVESMKKLNRNSSMKKVGGGGAAKSSPLVAPAKMPSDNSSASTSLLVGSGSSTDSNAAGNNPATKAKNFSGSIDVPFGLSSPTSSNNPALPEEINSTYITIRHLYYDTRIEIEERKPRVDYKLIEDMVSRQESIERRLPAVKTLAEQMQAQQSLYSASQDLVRELKTIRAQLRQKRDMTVYK